MKPGGEIYSPPGPSFLGRVDSGKGSTIPVICLPF